MPSYAWTTRLSSSFDENIIAASDKDFRLVGFDAFSDLISTTTEAEGMDATLLEFVECSDLPRSSAMVCSVQDGDRSDMTHNGMPASTEEEGDWSCIVVGPVLYSWKRCFF